MSIDISDDVYLLWKESTTQRCFHRSCLTAQGSVTSADCAHITAMRSNKYLIGSLKTTSLFARRLYDGMHKVYQKRAVVFDRNYVAKSRSGGTGRASMMSYLTSKRQCIFALRQFQKLRLVIIQ